MHVGKAGVSPATALCQLTDKKCSVDCRYCLSGGAPDVDGTGEPCKIFNVCILSYSENSVIFELTFRHVVIDISFDISSRPQRPYFRKTRPGKFSMMHDIRMTGSL